jgi:hypothetical protein
MHDTIENVLNNLKAIIHKSIVFSFTNVCYYFYVITTMFLLQVFIQRDDIIFYAINVSYMLNKWCVQRLYGGDCSMLDVITMFSIGLDSLLERNLLRCKESAKGTWFSSWLI